MEPLEPRGQYGGIQSKLPTSPERRPCVSPASLFKSVFVIINIININIKFLL